jgi:hypothetical protein
MSVQPELEAARDDVQSARDHLHDTITELGDRITAPIGAVKERLDVGRMVREHPWTALGVAVGAGALVAGSGADERAAAATTRAARGGTSAALQAARRIGRAAPEDASAARVEKPGRIAMAIDAISVKLAVTLIEALREPRVAPLEPEPQSGLGFVDNPAPAHEGEAVG